VKPATRFEIVSVVAPGSDVDAVRDLFLEYGESLGFNTCFGGFEQELTTLPGEYAPPSGILLLAMEGGARAGCVAVRPLGEGVCEMKRLYVRPQFRRLGLGRRLAESAIATARTAGCRWVNLDTLPAMVEARALYSTLGFRPCAPYYNNVCLGTDCYALDLQAPVTDKR